MMALFERELFPNVKLTAVQTDKFKTSVCAMHFLQPQTEAHASEHALLPALLRRGTQTHGDMLSLSAALDGLYGAAIEPMVRKKGACQCFGFFASFLDDTYIPEEGGMLDRALGLLAELFLSPAGEDGFVPAYFESEKENLRRRIRSRINDKQQYAIYRLISQMFQGEAYGIDRLGEEAQLDLITAEGLYAQYQDLLRTSPIHIYYCGSAPVEKLVSALESALAGLPQGERKAWTAQETGALPKPQDVRNFSDHLDVTQGKLVLGFRMAERSMDAKAQALVSIFNALYGGSTTAKLFTHVRERLSLCYYASSMAEKHQGFLLVSSGIAFEQYEAAKAEILAQLEDCKNGVITEEEFAFARRYVQNQWRLTEDAQGRLEEYYLSQTVAKMPSTPQDLLQASEHLTKEDVAQFAKGLTLDSVYFLQAKEVLA